MFVYLMLDDCMGIIEYLGDFFVGEFVWICESN